MAAPTKEALYEIAKQALPRFLFESGERNEMLWAAASIFERVGQLVDERFNATKIAAAPAPWINLHAADRGSAPQANEPLAGLQERLRQIADVATVPALKSAIDSVLEAAWTGGTRNATGILELASQGAFVGQAYVSQGYRTGCIRPQRIIVILPYGTTADAAAGVGEQLRKKHGAGFPYTIEVRQVP
jgi:hypothetical protein